MKYFKRNSFYHFTWTFVNVEAQSRKNAKQLNVNQKVNRIAVCKRHAWFKKKMKEPYHYWGWDMDPPCRAWDKRTVQVVEMFFSPALNTFQTSIVSLEKSWLPFLGLHRYYIDKCCTKRYYMEMYKEKCGKLNKYNATIHTVVHTTEYFCSLQDRKSCNIHPLALIWPPVTINSSTLLRNFWLGAALISAVSQYQRHKPESWFAEVIGILPTWWKKCIQKMERVTNCPVQMYFLQHP